jgi:hypothetical protein
MVGIPLLRLISHTKMKITMNVYKKLFALFLIGLFLAFSFNAYACLVPIYTNIPFTQGNDCNMPGEEPVSQFCDGFKTLAVYSGYDSPATDHAHVPSIGEISSLPPDLARSRAVIFPPDYSHMVFQKDILLRISVFRI